MCVCLTGGDYDDHVLLVVVFSVLYLFLAVLVLFVSCLSHILYVFLWASKHFIIVLKNLEIKLRSGL